jgi:hypothetical protein
MNNFLNFLKSILKVLSDAVGGSVRGLLGQREAKSMSNRIARLEGIVAFLVDESSDVKNVLSDTLVRVSDLELSEDLDSHE